MRQNCPFATWIFPPEAVQHEREISNTQGGKNWILPKEISANRFFWDSYWLETWKKRFLSLYGTEWKQRGQGHSCHLCLLRLTLEWAGTMAASNSRGGGGLEGRWEGGGDPSEPVRDTPRCNTNTFKFIFYKYCSNKTIWPLKSTSETEQYNNFCKALSTRLISLSHQ